MTYPAHPARATVIWRDDFAAAFDASGPRAPWRYVQATRELTADDALELRSLVEEHLQRTASPVAARVLESWAALLAAGAFVKVMPHDYKRVLAQREAPAPAGDDDPAFEPLHSEPRDCSARGGIYGSPGNASAAAWVTPPQQLLK